MRKPTKADIEKYIFQKWDNVLRRLAEGPSEPFPAFHDLSQPSQFNPEREFSQTTTNDPLGLGLGL